MTSPTAGSGATTVEAGLDLRGAPLDTIRVARVARPGP